MSDLDGHGRESDVTGQHDVASVSEAHPGCRVAQTPGGVSVEQRELLSSCRGRPVRGGGGLARCSS